MIAGLKPYPKMKDSGIEWLGQVPAHWEVRKLKYWLAINLRVLPESTPPDSEFRYIDIACVSSGRLTAEPQNMRFRDAPSRARRVVRPGDTIVSTVRTYLKAVYFARDSAGDLVASTGFAVLTPNEKTEPKFVSYLAQSDGFTHRVTAESVGIAYPAIAETRLASFEVSVPPLPEQTAIVRFLDYVDRRIRRYIRAKQKLIKLLEEYKQALIHQAVTGRIDVRTSKPYPEYEDSGVEWLGQVPAHWEVRRVKTLFRLRIDKSGIGHGKELLSIYTHIGVRPRKDLEEKGNKASTTDHYWIVKKGDIICNKLLAWMGAIGVSHFDGVTSPAYDILTPVVELSPDYYHDLFRTNRCLQEFKQRSRGIMDMRLRLYFDQFGQLLVPFPPSEEQCAIVEYCDRVRSSIDRAASAARREIKLLEEFRTRLIADVVTGKLDVREVAARLPEESEEPEPLDERESDAEETELADGLDDTAVEVDA